MKTKRNILFYDTPHFPKFMSTKCVAIIFQARKINLFIFIRAELLFCLSYFLFMCLVYLFCLCVYLFIYNVDLNIRIRNAKYKNEERQI